MGYSLLRSSNPSLFLDGIARGSIPYERSGCGYAVGEGQPNPTITSFLGGPYGPDGSSFNFNASTVPTGASGSYPKPFLSFSQRTNNGVNNFLGPYGRIVGISQITDTCVDGCGDDQSYESGEGLWGRLGTITSGANAGETGFFLQDWYNFNDGTYGAAFWSTYFELGETEAWPDKKQWWKSTTKSTRQAYLFCSGFSSDIIVDVEFAYAAPEFDDPGYFKGPDLSGFNNLSYQILTLMLATAAIRRWF